MKVDILVSLAMGGVLLLSRATNPGTWK